LEEQLEKVARWLKESHHTVILTGAGISTESGLSDFRSRQGMWKQFDFQKVASADSLLDTYDDFHAFYMLRVDEMHRCTPNGGHDVLAKWEKKGYVQTVVTQNVDGYHQKAGSANVIELHGNIYSFSCDICGVAVSEEEFIHKLYCTRCKCNRETLRPNVVLFDEQLPKKALQSARESFKQADLVIVIGTSLKVFPAANLPSLTSGKTV
jgi:NAD-dependent deacetylase